MNKNGFISIYTIFFSILFLLLLLGRLSINYNLREVNRYSEESLDGYYKAQNKLYLLLYEEYYYEKQLLPIIINDIRFMKNTPGPTYIKMLSRDLENNDKSDLIKLDFLDRINRGLISIEVKYRNNNIDTVLSSEISMINNIFFEKQPYIELEEQKHQIENLNKLKSAYNQDKYLYIYDSDDYLEDINDNVDYIRLLNTEDGLKKIVESGESYIYDNKIKLILDGKNSKLKISKNKDFFTHIILKGIIYVNGNIVIEDNLDFEGIIICDGSLEIREGGSLTNKGIIVCNKVKGENLNAVYNIRNIYRYGTYLPGFIDIDIKKIKGR